jgi:hypothetical protein
MVDIGHRLILSISAERSQIMGAVEKHLKGVIYLGHSGLDENKSTNLNLSRI